MSCELKRFNCISHLYKFHMLEYPKIHDHVKAFICVSHLDSTVVITCVLHKTKCSLTNVIRPSLNSHDCEIWDHKWHVILYYNSIDIDFESVKMKNPWSYLPCRSLHSLVHQTLYLVSPILYVIVNRPCSVTNRKCKPNTLFVIPCLRKKGGGIIVVHCYEYCHFPSVLFIRISIIRDNISSHNC